MLAFAIGAKHIQYNALHGFLAIAAKPCFDALSITAFFGQ
jgi:hypothetical protein